MSTVGFAPFKRLLAEWHPRKNAPLTPDTVLPGSIKRVWWRCRFNRYHEWLATPYNRTKNGSGCPQCYYDLLRRGRRSRRKRRVGVPLRLPLG